MCLPIYLQASLPAYLYVCLLTYASIYLPVCPYLSVLPYPPLSTYLLVTTYLPIHPPTYIPAYLPTCPCCCASVLPCDCQVHHQLLDRTRARILWTIVHSSTEHTMVSQPTSYCSFTKSKADSSHSSPATGSFYTLVPYFCALLSASSSLFRKLCVPT